MYTHATLPTTKSPPQVEHEKKRQARKVIKQVLHQDKPTTLPSGQRASNRAIRREKASSPELDNGPSTQAMKQIAALARRFDSARRRQEKASNRRYQRTGRSRRLRNMRTRPTAADRNRTTTP